MLTGTLTGTVTGTIITMVTGTGTVITMVAGTVITMVTGTVITMVTTTPAVTVLCGTMRLAMRQVGGATMPVGTSTTPTARGTLIKTSPNRLWATWTCYRLANRLWVTWACYRSVGRGRQSPRSSLDRPVRAG